MLLVDDLIATGGTAEAAVKLIESNGRHTCVECAFVIDLPDLGGRKRLEKRWASQESSRCASSRGIEAMTSPAGNEAWRRCVGATATWR